MPSIGVVSLALIVTVLADASLLDQDATAGRLMTASHRCDGFQRHVAGALDGPLIILFEEQGSDEAHDGLVVGE